MTTEIKSEIEKNSAEIEELSAKLAVLQEKQKTLVRKYEEQKKVESFNFTKAAILHIWRDYWPEDVKSSSEVRKRLDAVNDICRLKVWLDADARAAIKIALSKSDQEGACKVMQLCKMGNVDPEKCYEDAKIRLDFARALRNVKEGSDLSGALNWSFAPEDLLELGKMHKKNRYRKKIENLLTNCNFHTECGLLSAGNYEEFLRYVTKKED